MGKYFSGPDDILDLPEDHDGLQVMGTGGLIDDPASVPRDPNSRLDPEAEDWDGSFFSPRD